MAYQFIHVEGYGRAAGKGKKGGHNVASIVAEAERIPEACPHIEAPQPPSLLYGCSPKEAGEQARAWASQAVDARGHALRKDALCMLGGVLSLPAGMADRWDGFSKDSVAWLRHEYGRRLLSVVEHLDEAHPHLHFYVVPLKGERFSAIHGGLAAAEKADPARGDRTRPQAEKTLGRKKARDAYAEAMRKWQDDFHARVSRRYGLARIGPRRRRLSRDEYKAENATREGLAAQETAIAVKSSELAARSQALEARIAAVPALEAAIKQAAEVQIKDAYRQVNEWAANRDKEADAKAYARLKKQLPPEMAAALEAKVRGDRGYSR